jgi:hypothetical protein
MTHKRRRAKRGVSVLCLGEAEEESAALLKLTASIERLVGRPVFFLYFFSKMRRANRSPSLVFSPDFFPKMRRAKKAKRTTIKNGNAEVQLKQKKQAAHR